MSTPIDRLFVAYKPQGIGSNKYLSQIKRKYKVKKAGFSGTLDPFAKGVLIMAFGKYTKLFRFLKKAPKSYRATLWLGAYSETLDIEKISSVDMIPAFKTDQIINVLHSLLGELTYLPPKYSAKKVAGKKAYDLARLGENIKLKEITSTIFDIKLLHYKHPFVTFEITISEGGYIRSMGALIAEKLGVEGALTALERVHEGDFIFDDEKALDPLLFLNLNENYYLGDPEDLMLGRKVSVENFQIQDEGSYVVKLDKMFSIIQITDGLVKYQLNGVNYAHTRSQNE